MKDTRGYIQHFREDVVPAGKWALVWFAIALLFVLAFLLYNR